MAEISTTDNTDQSSSDFSNDDSLLDNGQQASADEQQDTGSSDSQSQDSGQDSDGRTSGTTQDESSDDDEGLAKFARAQGFDPENLTDGEARALKLARKQQQEFHKERQRQAEEARKAIDQVHQPDENDELDFEERFGSQLAQVQAVQRLQDFYLGNPDARDYDTEMGEILVEEADTYGKEAARALARNMPRLLREAKARRGDNDAEAAREAGRREERERLRKSQEGSGESSSATNRGSGRSSKVTRDWVRNEYDSSNPDHVKLLDDAMARGDLY